MRCNAMQCNVMQGYANMFFLCYATLCCAMFTHVQCHVITLHYVVMYACKDGQIDTYLHTHVLYVCVYIYVCMYVCVYMHIVPKPNCGISHGNISPDILICRSLLRLRCPESFQLHRPFGGTQLAHTHTNRQIDRQIDTHCHMPREDGDFMFMFFPCLMTGSAACWSFATIGLSSS